MQKNVFLIIFLFLVNSVYAAERFDVSICNEVHNERAFLKASVEKNCYLYFSVTDRNKKHHKLRISSTGIELLNDAIYCNSSRKNYFIQLQEHAKKENPKTFNCSLSDTWFPHITDYWGQIADTALLEKEEGECSKITVISKQIPADVSTIHADILIKTHTSIKEFLGITLHCVKEGEEKAFMFSDAAVENFVSCATVIPITYHNKYSFSGRFFYITLDGVTYAVQLNQNTSRLVESCSKFLDQKKKQITPEPALVETLFEKKEQRVFALLSLDPLEDIEGVACTLVSQDTKWYIIGNGNSNIAVDLTKHDLELINKATETFYLIVGQACYEIRQVNNNLLAEKSQVAQQELEEVVTDNIVPHDPVNQDLPINNGSLPKGHQKMEASCAPFYQTRYFLAISSLLAVSIVSIMIFLHKNSYF